jgi:hypothetical protein
MHDAHLRVAIWCAVSSKPQASEDKISLQDQEAAGRESAAALGAQVGVSPKEVRLQKPPLRAVVQSGSVQAGVMRLMRRSIQTA